MESLRDAFRAEAVSHGRCLETFWGVGTWRGGAPGISYVEARSCRYTSFNVLASPPSLPAKNYLVASAEIAVPSQGHTAGQGPQSLKDSPVAPCLARSRGAVPPSALTFLYLGEELLKFSPRVDSVSV